MSVPDISPTNRMERRRLQTREHLKQAAYELLMEMGYPNLTIKAITERADVGYGTFYLHFADKDDIVWAVVFDLNEIWRKQVDTRLDPVPSPKREYRSWILIFEYVATLREGFVAMFGRNGSAKLFQRYQDYLAQLHQTNLTTGRYTAALDMPVEFLAQYSSGALMRIMLWWAETPNPYTPEQMARMIYQTAYRQPPPE